MMPVPGLPDPELATRAAAWAVIPVSDSDLTEVEFRTVLDSAVESLEAEELAQFGRYAVAPVRVPLLPDPGQVTDRSSPGWIVARSSLVPTSGEWGADSFHDEHPLLDDYREQWVDLFTLETVSDPEGLLARLDLAVRERTAGWRSGPRYLNPSALRGGSGLLASTPAGLASLLRTVLEDAGLHVSALPRRPPEEGRFELFLVGRSHVLAERFVVERLGPA